MKPDHPLLPWGLTFVVWTGLLMWGHALVPVDETERLWAERTAARIDTVSRSTDVAVIGSSVAQSIIGVQGQIESDADRQGAHWYIARLTMPGRAWDWEPIVEGLADHPPKVLLIELQVLVLNRKIPPPAQGWISRGVNGVRSAVLGLVAAAPRIASLREMREGGARRDMAWFDQIVFPTVPAVGANAGGDVLYWRERFHEPSPRGVAALRALRDRGCVVMVFYLPPHPIDTIPADYRIRLEAVEQQLEAERLAERLAVDVPASGYGDGVHLNREGGEAARAIVIRAVRTLAGAR